MPGRFLILIVGLLVGALVFPAYKFAQNNSTPAPRRSLAGLWGSRDGGQVRGVQLRPHDGKPENQPPYTPHGLELFRSHKALEGADAVPTAFGNDPRALCEPLGFPRVNHYNLGVQILQDEYKVAILYQYDNRWRIVWTDGRPLPKLLEGGVEIDGDYREQRWFGYSVGKWLDDYTLEVQTVGTMPEDRVWLDNAGRPVSDQVRVTETFHRLDHDTLEWSETIEDPIMYTGPWQTMKMRMTLQDPRMDVLTRYCSPVELEYYNKTYGNPVSGQ